MHRRNFLPIAALSTASAAAQAPAQGITDSAQIAWHYVARVTLNFATGAGTVIGYFTHLQGIGSGPELFREGLGEAAALFTFRADIQILPLPGNGELGPGQFAVFAALVLPGDFTVYYNPAAGARWDQPDTFASGAAIATLARSGEQFSLLGATSVNAASAAVKSTETFTFQDRQHDLRNTLRKGVTNISMGNTAVLPGSTPVVQSFAVAGYGLVIA
jgi:hypothetical protein